MKTKKGGFGHGRNGNGDLAEAPNRGGGGASGGADPEKYKQGKAHLESRIIDNEQFWKMRHWQQMEKNGQGGNPADPQPTSGWLVNCILSKHADAMDCYPEPTVLPREEGDRMEAGKLTKILPVVLKQNQFKRTYSDAWWYKLKSGCAAYGVFWDAGKLGGLGDIAIRRMDLLNLFWEPGCGTFRTRRTFSPRSW